MSSAGGKADFYIDGEVSIAPAGSGKQHVKIVWRVRSASGAEIGTVGQENDVPSGSLSGPWGDVAYIVALAAGEGLVQVLARAGRPRPRRAATGPEAVPSAENSRRREPGSRARLRENREDKGEAVMPVRLIRIMMLALSAAAAVAPAGAELVSAGRRAAEPGQ